jgi:hypothetical protein
MTFKSILKIKKNSEKSMKNTENKTPNVIKFSLIDPDDTFELPSYEESDARGKALVNWGVDNRFPNNLFEMSQSSPSLSAIINGTVELIKGEHIEINPDIHAAQDLYYYPFLNRNEETASEVVEQLVRDYMLYGTFAIQVIYNKLDKKAELVALPAEYIRMNEDREVIYFCKKWRKFTTNAVVYDKFDDSNIVDHKSQVFVYVNSGNRQVYGISPQNAALEDIASEAFAAKYIRKSLQSGLSARYIMDLPNTANLTDEQKAEIEEGITEKFTGWTNAGSFALYFNNGDKEMKLTKVDLDNSNEIFKSIREAASQNIFIVNHATPNLFGLPTATTGFNDQEYAAAYELYNKMTLVPIKAAICKAFNKIFHINDAITFTNKNNQIENNGE